MNKVRKLFNSLILSFVLMGIICAGIFISHGINLEDKLMSSYADAMEYDTISNSLPQYFKIDVSSGNGAKLGKLTTQYICSKVIVLKKSKLEIKF